MDPLSEVLSLLKPVSLMSGGFDMGGDWSVQFPAHEGVKCYALHSGRSWLTVQDVADPVLVNAGDCFLLPSGRPFRLASDLAREPVDAHTLFRFPMNGAVRTFNGGGGCFGVGGHFRLGGRHADILLGMLPPIVHIRKESDRAAMRWSIERMMLELREPQPGGFLIGQQLACMMLVQALRLHLADGAGNNGARGGWLFALADRQMGAAIGAMHAQPGERWTLQALAEHVGMSRSSFAQKFKEVVGQAPLEYLTRWRMLLAGERLLHSTAPVAAIAGALGYESEAAFGTAFKRVMGCSPRQYGQASMVRDGDDHRAGAIL
jgi:AraC-like DNA-binding protein